MSGLEHLEQLRLEELAEVLPYLPLRGRVLEVGAGSGFQARDLEARGFLVEAVDLSSSPYAATRVFPVRDYDGSTLPFPAASFDAVLSSNVLEHVIDLPALLAEMRRVLRPGGVMVHVLPTATWRIWTTLSHYLFIAKRLAQRIATRVGDPAPAGASAPGPGFRVRLLFPTRHGEHGSAGSELWLFSRWRWQRVFERAELCVVAERRSGLFYTGYEVSGARLSLATRRALGSVLGSSTRIWVLEPRA